MKFLLMLIMKPINWVLSFIFGIIAFFIMLFVIFALTFNFWIPKVAPWIVSTDSGFHLNIGESKSNIFTLNFNFYDLSIKNNDAFPYPDFIKMDRFSLDFLLFSLLTQKVVVEDFILDIPQVVYVKNADGQNNVSSFLSEVFTDKKGIMDKKPADESDKKSGQTIYFEHFALRLGKVVMMDYSQNPVKIDEYNLNYFIEFNNTYADKVLSKITNDLKSRGVLFLMQAVLNSLTDISLLNNVSSTVMKANGMATDAVNKTLDVGKDAIDKFKKIFK